jgi:preprotein translocase subunit SecG
MSTFLIILHVVVCIALIMIVLLQTGKGADMGAAFGGGASQTLFGSTGTSTFLGKLTTVAAVIFMLTSLTLAYKASNKGKQSIMLDQKAPIEQPATQPAPEENAQPSPAPAAPQQANPEKAK